MFDAVCAKCGQDCQVPFKPNGRKEVFCSKCFETNGGESRGGNDFRDSGAPRRFERRDNVDTYFAEKQMFSAVCDECGESCKVPFQPRNGNPVLCSNCFAAKKDGGYRTNSSSRPVRESNLDLEAINAKLDKIIKMLSKDTKEIVAETPKEITEKIMEEIQIGTEKKLSTKKKAKKVSKIKE